MKQRRIGVDVFVRINQVETIRVNAKDCRDVQYAQCSAVGHFYQLHLQPKQVLHVCGRILLAPAVCDTFFVIRVC